MTDKIPTTAADMAPMPTTKGDIARRLGEIERALDNIRAQLDRLAASINPPHIEERALAAVREDIRRGGRILTQRL